MDLDAGQSEYIFRDAREHTGTLLNDWRAATKSSVSSASGR